ncbi:MAG: MurR/RpiR family transcriptional regulator [Streptococcaceae bacterium]|jgi:DNA-binding MurR/RpiR family transcriptional regulator|nr:MurR/RpiR family transcriptional regulator [Streptococcaceae bacterium]
MGIILESFLNNTSSLTKTELQLLTKIDNNPELSIEYNLIELAEKFFTSKTELIRMAQKLGFSGFSEFKFKIKSLVLLENTDNSNFISSLRDWVSAFPDLEDAKNIKYFIQKIHKADTVYITAVGVTKPLAEYFSKKLIGFDKRAVYIHEDPFLDLLPNLLRPNDIVIYLSVSGDVDILVNSAKKVNSLQQDPLAITGVRSSKLGRTVKRNISVKSSMSYYHGYDISSRAYLMIIIDTILEHYHANYLINSAV